MRPNGYICTGGHLYDCEVPERVLQRIKERTAFAAMRVERSKKPCDLWLGGLSGGGRPRIAWFDGMQDIVAAVTSILYRQHRGVEGALPEGYLLCHTCDVATCVNPEHVYLGTPKYNGSDRRHRGTAAFQGIRAVEIFTQMRLRQRLVPHAPLPKWLRQQARLHGFVPIAGTWGRSASQWLETHSLPPMRAVVWAEI